MAENLASRSGYQCDALTPISFSRSKTMDLGFRSPINRTFSSAFTAFTRIAPETREGPDLDYRLSNIRSRRTEGPYLWRAPLAPAQLLRSACPITRPKQQYRFTSSAWPLPPSPDQSETSPNVGFLGQEHCLPVSDVDGRDSQAPLRPRAPSHRFPIAPRRRVCPRPK